MNNLSKIIIFLCCFLFLSNTTPTPNIITSKHLQKLQPKLTNTVSTEYIHLINKYCSGIETSLVVSIMFVESSLLYYRVNNNHDWGLGQVNLPTWGTTYKVDKWDLLNPITNIEISCKILKQLKKSRPKDEHYWAYYHNSNSILRQRYIQRVTHILNKLKEMKW